MPDTSTEATILEAAKQTFIQKGYSGTRMQEIADTAGINKAMLHYYFRSKEKLFRVILTESISILTPLMERCLSADQGVIEKLENLIETHINVLKEHPHLPMFVMHELSQNQGKFVTELKDLTDSQPLVMAFFQQVYEEGEAGKIQLIDPVHLLLNIMSMIVFPFIAKPMVTTVTGMPDELFNGFLEQRKEVVTNFMRSALLVR